MAFRLPSQAPRNGVGIGLEKQPGLYKTTAVLVTLLWTFASDYITPFIVDSDNLAKHTLNRRAMIVCRYRQAFLFGNCRKISS